MKKTIRMGRVMKRAVSMLLVLAMAASPALAAPYSAADDAEVGVQAGVAESAGTTGASDAGTEADANTASLEREAGSSGELHLTLHRTQAMAETTFTATLQSE